jgi:hypothetical protein
VPCPGRRVVKNGSNTRASICGGTPSPVSVTDSTTYEPAARSADGAPMWTLRVRMVSSPPPFIASRALMVRLSRASSNSAASTFTHDGSASATKRTRMEEPREVRSSSIIPGTASLTAITSGVTAWRREKASSWRVRRVPLATARSIAAICGLPDVCGTRRASRCRLLLTTISRLLKSCATPPVSWPSA